jgi:hypothetical protein
VNNELRNPGHSTVMGLRKQRRAVADELSINERAREDRLMVLQKAAELCSAEPN